MSDHGSTCYTCKAHMDIIDSQLCCEQQHPHGAIATAFKKHKHPPQRREGVERICTTRTARATPQRMAKPISLSKNFQLLLELHCSRDHWSFPALKESSVPNTNNIANDANEDTEQGIEGGQSDIKKDPRPSAASGASGIEHSSGLSIGVPTRRDYDKDTRPSATGGASGIEHSSGLSIDVPTRRDYNKDPRPRAASGASGIKPSSELGSNVSPRHDIDKDPRRSTSEGAGGTEPSSGLDSDIPTRRDVEKDTRPSAANDASGTGNNAPPLQHHQTRDTHKTCKPACKIDAQPRSKKYQCSTCSFEQHSLMHAAQACIMRLAYERTPIVRLVPAKLTRIYQCSACTNRQHAVMGGGSQTCIMCLSSPAIPTLKQVQALKRNEVGAAHHPREDDDTSSPQPQQDPAPARTVIKHHLTATVRTAPMHQTYYAPIKATTREWPSAAETTPSRIDEARHHTQAPEHGDQHQRFAGATDVEVAASLKVVGLARKLRAATKELQKLRTVMVEPARAIVNKAQIDFKRKCVSESKERHGTELKMYDVDGEAQRKLSNQILASSHLQPREPNRRARAQANSRKDQRGKKPDRRQHRGGEVHFTSYK